MNAERWIVVWFAPERREALFSDKALAEAYAAAHRGVVVPMAAMGTWPVREQLVAAAFPADSSNTPKT